jgi:hypothetical protein
LEPAFALPKLFIGEAGMRHLQKSCFIFLGISFLAAGQNFEIREGVIQGVVLDEEGNPLSGAKVHAELKGIPMAKAIRFVESDRNGFFLIDRLEFGTYCVGALKEEDGYGPSDNSFFNDKPLPTIQISVQNRIANAVVNLGPRAGILMGTIRDAFTGKPISVGFDLVQVKDRTKWMRTSAPPQFRVLIPSSKEIEVKVSAAGYEPWFYPDPSIPSQVLRMEPGSQVHVDVLLKPTPDHRVPISKFLIPEGYVGWLRVEHGVECAPAIPVEDGVRIFRFSGTGVLETSSPLAEQAAERQYFYYAADGSERNLAADYRNGDGMIWKESPGSRGGKMKMFIFFVGTEEQSKSRPLTGFPAPACP